MNNQVVSFTQKRPQFKKKAVIVRTNSTNLPYLESDLLDYYKTEYFCYRISFSMLLSSRNSVIYF